MTNSFAHFSLPLKTNSCCRVSASFWRLRASLNQWDLKSCCPLGPFLFSQVPAGLSAEAQVLQWSVFTRWGQAWAAGALVTSLHLPGDAACGAMTAAHIKRSCGQRRTGQGSEHMQHCSWRLSSGGELKLVCSDKTTL